MSGITSIEADQIHAELDANVGGGSGGLQRIVTNGAASSGDFTGSVVTDDIFATGFPVGLGTAEVTIAGDLEASFEIVHDVDVPVSAGGSLVGDWTLGGSLLGVVALGSGNLLGQIIINSDDDGGVWSGDVTVGSTTLSPKGAYTQTGLGGGAVGLAPFDLHKQDCDPAYSGSTAPTTTSSTIEIDLVHYGPIRHDGGGKPFKVEKYEGNCGPGGCPNEPDPNDTANWTLESISGRTMTISGPLVANHHSHVLPVRAGTDMLKCDDLDAAGDVPVAAYTYILYREP